MERKKKTAEGRERRREEEHKAGVSGSARQVKPTWRADGLNVCIL